MGPVRVPFLLSCRSVAGGVGGSRAGERGRGGRQPNRSKERLAGRYFHKLEQPHQQQQEEGEGEEAGGEERRRQGLNGPENVATNRQGVEKALGVIVQGLVVGVQG